MLLLFAPLLLDAQLPDFSWLTGNWCAPPKRGAVTCETWAPMEKGVMHGKGTTRAAERVTTNETMRITVDDSGIFFHAEPANQKPADFRAVAFSTEGRSVTFEDRSHDYPQRVRYWRDGEGLRAEISQFDGSKAMQWTFHRTPE
jgi:hypothetical protein